MTRDNPDYGEYWPDEDDSDIQSDNFTSMDDDYSIFTCHHGFAPASECEDCDAEINEDGGMDKCLNCGRYKTGNQLNADQVCKRGCVNPNEY